jgi:hypothetical protein
MRADTTNKGDVDGMAEPMAAEVIGMVALTNCGPQEISISCAAGT